LDSVNISARQLRCFRFGLSNRLFKIVKVQPMRLSPMW
jgi:hypothetical protein